MDLLPLYTRGHPPSGGPLPGLDPHSPNAWGEQRSEASASRCRFVKKDPEGERRDPGRLLSPHLASPAPPPGAAVPPRAPGKPGGGLAQGAQARGHQGRGLRARSWAHTAACVCPTGGRTLRLSLSMFISCSGQGARPGLLTGSTAVVPSLGQPSCPPGSEPWSCSVGTGEGRVVPRPEPQPWARWEAEPAATSP